MYTFAMSRLRHVTIAIVCFLIALPSWVFATCCCDTTCYCRITGASQCCQSSACCCGCSLPTEDSCCPSTIGNQCDFDCQCCTGGPSKKAVRSSKGETNLCDLTPSSERYEFAPPVSTLGKGFDSFACRPLSHNRRQAKLCVWLK